MSTSPYAHISAIYRAEVTIPEDVFRAFGHTAEYDYISRAAANLVETSGQNSYANVIEWGETPLQRQAVEFTEFWHNWILQWKERL